MRTVHVYVAAPFEDAPMVREVHAQLGVHRVVWTSTWATKADVTIPEEPTAKRVFMRACAAENYAAIRHSDAMLVLARPGAGGEMFVEAGYALMLQIPVVWIGRTILSAYRDGVQIVENLDEALVHLDQMARYLRVRELRGAA